MESWAPYIPPALYALVESLAEPLAELAPWAGVALVSLGAAYLSYLFVLGRREAAVAFNVPIPPEVRPNWNGRKWDEVEGEDRKLLEGQIRGVSFVHWFSGWSVI